MTDAPLPTKVVAKAATSASSNETMVDLLMGRAMDLLRLEAGTRDKVAVFLNELEGEIVAALAKIDPTGIESVTFQQKRLQRLLTLVNNSIKATYRTSNTLMGEEIRNIADAESTWTGSAINVATHAEFANVGLTTTLLDTLVSDILIQGAPTKDWWSRQAAGLADRFADQMRQGIALGETNADLIARVRGTDTVTGLMDIAKSSASRLVRSSVQTAANAARNKTYENNADLIDSVMWHATLDTRTSIYCITRDGHQYSLPDHAPVDDGPPWLQGPGALHWNCRSTSVPILKSWQDLGIDAEDVPAKTRASMDGQVPAPTTFEAWLKKQNQTRQNDVLGKGKADLWRSGKIGFADLLDQSGRPLTTAELERKAAAQS